jgi:hypothetical protein
MSVLTGNRALVLIYSQTFPIYPYGSARDPSKTKTTIVENPSIGQKCDIDAVYLKGFFRKIFHGGADIGVKKEPSFAETCEDITKRIQSGKKYDYYFIIFLTFVDDKERLQFNEPNFEQGLQKVDVFVSLVMDLQREIDGKPVIFLIQADDLTLLDEQTKQKASVFTGDRDRILETEPTNQGFLLIRSTIPQKITEKESLLVRAFVEAMENNMTKSGREQKDMASLMDNIKHQVIMMVRNETRSSRTSDMPEPIVQSCLSQPLKM